MYSVGYGRGVGGRLDNYGRHRRQACAPCGLVYGAALFVGSFILLFNNERSSVAVSTTLEKGLIRVHELDSLDPDPAYAGSLVCVSGDLIVTAVTDPVLGVTTFGLSLRRSVEMLQWTKPERDRDRLRARYGKHGFVQPYDGLEWSERPVDSSRYENRKYQNPAEWPLTSETFTVGTLVDSHIGAPRALPFA